MRFWEGVSTLVGMIIGAGVLGLPFVIAKIGILPGILLLILLGVALLIVNLMFAEVILRTKKKRQLVGYAGKYLGKKAKYLELFAMLISGYGVLLAYIIGEGVVLASLFGGSAFLFSLIFLAIMVFVLFFGLKIIKVFELWMVFIFMIVMAVILFISGFHIDIENYKHLDISNIFLAYGVILFAFAGAESVVSVCHILKGNEKKVKKAVIVASIIPIIIYILFAVGVVGVTGLNTTEVATVGLGDNVGVFMLLFGNLFAIFAMGTSFLAKGEVMKELFQFDFKLTRINSWLLIVLPPLIMFMFGWRDFINTIGVVGGLSIGITGTLIVLMFWKAKKKGNRKPEFSLPKLKFIGLALVAVFVLGLIYTVLNLIQ